MCAYLNKRNKDTFKRKACFDDAKRNKKIKIDMFVEDIPHEDINEEDGN